MSLPPVVTYISVAYTTSTDITVTTTVIPTFIGMFTVLSSSPTATFVVTGSDTTCSTTTSAATLSTSFITSASMTSAASLSTTFITSTTSDTRDSTSSTMSVTASSSTGSTSSSAVASTAATSAIPVSATLLPPSASNSTIPLTAEISHASIGVPGTIGLSAALGILFAAITAFFCYHRRKRKLHKEAMLIAPRLHPSHQSTETGKGTLLSSDSNTDSFMQNAALGHTYPQPPIPQNIHAVPSTTPPPTPNTYEHTPRTSSSTHPGTASRETPGPVPAAEGKASLENSTYAIRYHTGGFLTTETNAAPADSRSSNGPNSPSRWDEALSRLNSIAAVGTLQRELSPPPLSVVKRSTPVHEDLIPRPQRGRPPPHSTDSDMGAVGPGLRDGLDGVRNEERDIQITRATALARLEGRSDRDTVESRYSRWPDGTLLHGGRGGEGGDAAGWRDLEGRRWWPG